MKRDFARTIRGALIPVGLLSLLTACASVEGAPTFEHPPAPVVVSTAVERDVPVYLEQIGKCAAVETVSIRAQVSGRVTQIHFRDGAFVKRGQRLFTIDPRPYLAQLHSAQANAARERSLLRQAEAAVAQRTAVERLERLRPPGSISTMSAAVATAALRRPELARANVERLAAERGWFSAALAAVGWAPHPSVTNFLLVRIGDHEGAEAAAERLLHGGIVTRTFGPANPLRGHLRITVRSRVENERFLEVIRP